MTKSIIDDAPFGAIHRKLLLLSSGGPSWTATYR
jgi:hypothetical protein